MTRFTTWLNRHLILLGVIGGTATAIVGAATLAGILTARWLGPTAGWATAATVTGAATAKAALAWSRLAVIEEDR